MPTIVAETKANKTHITFYIYLIDLDVMVSLRAIAVFGFVVQRSFRMRESVKRKPHNRQKTVYKLAYSSEYSLFCGINKQNRSKDE